jgi:O-methyltransferase domain
VADISAGHGLYGIAIGKAVPGAEIIAVDWGPVLKVAEANAAAAGLAGRYRLRPGSAFDVDWGSNLDLVMLPSFLHHFDWDGCVALLGKARQNLAEKGRVVVVEYVVNEDRISPPFPAMFAFIMLGSTPSGDAYTKRQLEEMGRAAGFARANFRPVPPTPHTFVTFDRS